MLQPIPHTSVVLQVPQLYMHGRADTLSYHRLRPSARPPQISWKRFLTFAIRGLQVPLPDVRGRAEILTHYLADKPVAPDVDVMLLARATPGEQGTPDRSGPQHSLQTIAVPPDFQSSRFTA